MSEKIYFVDHIIAKEGKIDELIKAFKPISEHCLSNKNCLTYDVYQDENNKRSFVLYESWTNQSDYDSYLASRTDEHKANAKYRNSLLDKGIDFDQTFRQVI